MNVTTLKNYYLAIFTLVFIYGSHYAFAMPIHTMDVQDQVLSINTMPVSDDAVNRIMDGCDETAFAFLNNDDDDPLTVDDQSTCFIPQFNRWGWTTFLDFSEETGQSSYTLDFYAGAGQCDLSKGSDVGSVTVTYNEDSTLTFSYDLEGYLLSEAHIYVGNDAYPTNNDGVETVAPGQYTFTDSDFGHLQNYVATIPVEGTAFHIIVHGVTMEEDCSDGECEDSDGDGVCDTDDICPGFDDTIDIDGNGIPDGCECEDSDGDGVCDTDDICPGFDDTIDSDGDGIPDGCDNVAYEAHVFNAYPIPFQDEVNVRYAFDYETFVNIEVYDIKGTKLLEIENNNYVQGTVGHTKLDLSRASSQLLFVRLTTVKNQFSKKIVSSNSRPINN